MSAARHRRIDWIYTAIIVTCVASFLVALLSGAGLR
jgi:hypothetical protein